MIRLDKYLSDAGIGTRKEIKEYIKNGLITVNGETVKNPALKVSVEKAADRTLSRLNVSVDTVCFKGKPVSPFSYSYILLNKPRGCVTATTDLRDKTVIDVLREAGLNPIPKDLAPVGRLDKDTTGLLLLTNNGAIAHELLSPKKHVDKLYHVSVDTPINENEIALFHDGIKLSDFTCMPAGLKILSDYEAEVTVHEGKYHQVKRMFKACGHTVTALKRIKMGELTLPEDLQEGKYIELSEEEIYKNIQDKE